MRNSVEKFLGLRFAIPVLIGTVVVLALISETAYRRAESTLTGGINLTDARIGAARLLQLLTEAESAQRGYLLTSNPTYIEPLRSAQREFNESETFLDFISGLGSTGPEDAKNIRATVSSKFDELDRTISMAQAGNRSGALALVQTDSGKKLMDELHVIFNRKLEEAKQMQQGARNQIYESLLFNRIAVLLLSSVLAISLYLYMLRTQAIERARVEYQDRLEKEVAEKTAGLRTLHAWLETAREDEKARLARELHDELGGILTSAKLMIARIRGKLLEETHLLAWLDTVNRQLNDGIAIKRKIIEDLHPSSLSLLGLKIALDNLCAEAEQQLGIPVIAEIADVQIGRHAELSVFRVFQEALTNIGKYSHATQVWVKLEQIADDIILKVVDNGVGFDPATLKAGSHGLKGMRFRIESHGGSFSVVSSESNGVIISAKLPKQYEGPVVLPSTAPAHFASSPTL